MPSKKKADPDEDKPPIDYKDPSFILKNIEYKSKFDPDPSSFSTQARNNMIECMCDQVCFHVMCAFRAHHLAASSSTLSLDERLKIKPPGILVYGSGVVAECVLEALTEMGCAPYIKVFARDVAGAKMWASKGYRSTIEMKDGYQISILLICCNLVGFSQMCRDLCQYLTAKTFIISNVFNLQRKRMYNLFGTPGIVRTFVERKGASNPPKEREISTRAFSARQLASKVDGVKNLILILENYMIALDIHKDTARREAMHLVVGSDRISLEKSNMNNPYKNKKDITFSDEESSSEESFDDFSDTDSSEFDSLDGRAKEVKLDLNPREMSDAEARKALFEIRVRSFQVEDAMKEEQKALERKQKRKERRLQQQVEQNKLNHEVHQHIQATTVPPSSSSASLSSPPHPASSFLIINTEKEEEKDAGTSPPPPLTQRGELSTSPILSPHSRRGSGHLLSSPSSPTPPPASSAALNRFYKITHGSPENHSPPSPSSRRHSVRLGFSGSKIKKMPKSQSADSADGSRSPHQQRKKDFMKSEKDEQREKEEQDERSRREEEEENDRRDKILGVFEKKEVGGLGFLHQMVGALAVQRKEVETSTNGKSPLLKIIRNIEKRYGEIFRKELSKHICVVDLPSLVHVKQKIPRRKARRTSLINTVLIQRAALARKNNLLSVMPTVVKKQVGYLSPEALLDIFNSDKKSSNLWEERSLLLEKIDNESDEEDKEGEGDDLFIEDVPRDKIRFFILETEENHEAVHL